ncbi:MAG: hypothetical protein BWY76_01005 [bacterium ADurb.Bin429]|nr:MAG: hypothetical protein BWY76_01005 [bacterium ADurb.Bin429]
MHTDLPEFVCPAMSMCGIFARSATRGCPAMSRPSTKVSGDFALRITSASNISRRSTSESSFVGTSMPTTPLPGTGASTRTSSASSASARSSARFTMRFTRMPGGGTTSKRTTRGPRSTAVTFPSMPKLRSVSSSRRIFSGVSSFCAPAGRGVSVSSVVGGSVYARASASSSALLAFGLRLRFPSGSGSDSSKVSCSGFSGDVAPVMGGNSSAGASCSTGASVSGGRMIGAGRTVGSGRIGGPASRRGVFSASSACSAATFAARAASRCSCRRWAMGLAIQRKK